MLHQMISSDPKQESSEEEVMQQSGKHFLISAESQFGCIKGIPQLFYYLSVIRKYQQVDSFGKSCKHYSPKGYW